MLKLDTANQIISFALGYGLRNNLDPLTAVVLDSRGCAKAVQSQDGSSLFRFQIAFGKAYGAIGLGIGSRAIFERAQQQPFFVEAVNTAADGALIPVPGGVLIKDADGNLLGSVGVTGDISDKDEAAAVAGIEAVGFNAATG
ncbi:Uncharacterized conserved protein GlcG, DUF336 family [Parasphingorhabdus marina DSM 22363]|uniref:Uncharacterized conserved protein GlcG, DUF336 family n=1 Tax=Parasphingorhabdus marina DSM 22363 TaxID=1123272 RepID=A0A1N6D3V0_9SPHN|nr:heme-binding protein [Parasphingorhabdus marina]SIN65498.1 Uncharacterized conserved protein GlcG, DUF336 family [Parasphingorhabdus marina DSM 22363]